MLKAMLVLLVIGTVLLLFGAWGRFSDAGQKRYDEMAGMIPYFSYYAGMLVLCIAAILLIIFIYRQQ